MACSREGPETDACLEEVEFTPTESTTSHSDRERSIANQHPSSNNTKLDCGERFGQDFEVQDSYYKLGSGISGIVFVATKLLDKKKYAIKRIKSKSEKQLREVENLAKLEHRHIVRYFTAWVDGDWLYIQLELCKSTLSDWLLKNVNRDKEILAKYFQQIISAVEFIHDKNLMHRDLKPSNIFFAENDDLKIGDFGLSTVHNEPDENLMQTDVTPGSIEHSQLKGTPDYMSPEQLARKKDYDTRTDIYSLGLIFLEMSTVTDFKEKRQIFEKARKGKFPKQEKFPPEKFKDLLDGMLAENPDDRWSAKKILENLLVLKTVKNRSKNKMTVNIGKITGNVMTGDNNVMNVYGSSSIEKGKVKKPATKPITNSNEQPSTDQLLDIKDRVGSNWKDLGRHLSFDDAFLEQMKINLDDIGEVVYQILLKWIQKDADKASKAKLANVFIKLGRGDLADFLAD